MLMCVDAHFLVLCSEGLRGKGSPAPVGTHGSDLGLIPSSAERGLGLQKHGWLPPAQGKCS